MQEPMLSVFATPLLALDRDLLNLDIPGGMTSSDLVGEIYTRIASFYTNGRVDYAALGAVLVYDPVGAPENTDFLDNFVLGMP